MGKESFKLVANNKKAYHDYFIDDKIEAGIELFGTEVKSIRMGKCSVKESFIKIEKGEMFIYGMHISPYEKASQGGDPEAGGQGGGEGLHAGASAGLL